MQMADNTKIDLLIEFRKLVNRCSFEKPTPFVYKDFPREAITKFYTNHAQTRDSRLLAGVLTTAMNESWKNNQLKFVPLLSSVDATGDFKFVFDNDDYRVHIVGGWQVNEVWKMKVESVVTFPVLIVFKPNSNCICC